MILSTRPTDRRQLIEEAAGVTKYKARRRTAELKLEAAQQNLTRIDDIVFEVEKQRGTLKRQASKARRYQKLRDELQAVGEGAARAEVPAAGADHRVGSRPPRRCARRRDGGGRHDWRPWNRIWPACESSSSRPKPSATTKREAAHACELGINRQQQQIAFDKNQIETLDARATSVTAELDTLNGRRDPARDLAAVAPPRRRPGQRRARRSGRRAGVRVERLQRRAPRNRRS